jgi:hypothetical protein
MIKQVLLYTGIHGYLVAIQDDADEVRKAKDTVYWPANKNAPYCGCQITYDLTENDDYQYVDRTCQIQFHYGIVLTKI